jgi:predicted nucleic acid-binding protein
MFISLLTGTHPARVAVIRQLIQQQEAAAIKIVVSTFVIAEVRPAPGLAPAQIQAMNELLGSDKLNYYVLTETIAKRAQQIGTDFPDLMPGDCTHIATALEAHAEVLFTFDGARTGRRRPANMIARSGQVGGDPILKITEPDAWFGTIFQGTSA